MQEPSLDAKVKTMNEELKGIWGDDPKAQTKIKNYLEQKDIYSDPQFRQSVPDAQRLLDVRTDSRGQPMKRALCGGPEPFRAVMERIAAAAQNNKNKTPKKSRGLLLAKGQSNRNTKPI